MTLGTKLALGSTLLSGGTGALAADKQGRAAAAAAKAQAKGEAAAASQEAAEDRRQARYAASRAQAVAAASGAGGVGAINKIAEIEGEGEYRALMRLHNGGQRANIAMSQARAARDEGRMGAVSSLMKAGSTMLNTDADIDWLEKYA
jgi:hypothetical protein